MSEKTIDVTVPGNGYVLTNPKLSPLQYYKGQSLDLRKLPLRTAQQMAANPACRWIQVEAPVVPKAKTVGPETPVAVKTEAPARSKSSGEGKS